MHEQGDRMLVYNMKWHSLQWITHVRPMLENYSDFLELADP